MDGGFGRALETSLESAILALIDHSRDSVMVVEADGTLSVVSTNGLAAMEIRDPGAVIGKPWESLWSTDSHAAAVDAVSRAAQGDHVRFEAKRDVEGTRRWDVLMSPARDGTGRITHLVSTARPLSQQVAQIVAAERTAELQTTVARETQHRLKNLITVIGSLSKLIARRSRSVDEFERSFQRQLIHLDRAQSLLTDGAGKDGTLSQVVSVVLEGEGRDSRITVGDLPGGRIGDGAVQLLALVLGELRTNAMKYGALSVESGEVSLEVQEVGDALRVTWTEDKGQPLPAPELNGGSGLDLIRRMIASTASEPEIGWTGRGLRLSFCTPRF